jgi:hypothetical protein
MACCLFKRGVAYFVKRRDTEWTAKESGFDSQKEQEIFLSSAASRPKLGSTQPPIQWVPGTLVLGVKRSGREADYFRRDFSELHNIIT